jgi:sugar/nucleoside kinase (ribokinase family)
MTGPETKLVIAVGSASGERVLKVEAGQFRLGAKHSVPPQRVLAGGSGVNSACRLLAMGVDVFPVLPVAHDSAGRAVVRALDSAARRGGRSVNYEGFYLEGDGAGTPFTTIMAVGAQRTVLNEFPAGIVRQFVRHCAARLEVLERAGGAPPHALIIGHIHADRETAQGGQSGGITQSLIERFSNEGVPVFANFGRAQYGLGTTRWEPYLDRLACFQLDIDEMRAFCADAGVWSLEAVLAWFRPRCTVAVTTERMGAVAQLKGSEQVILAWPYDLQPEDVVDTTGAGDAFGAGIVASSLTCPPAR